MLGKTDPQENFFDYYIKENFLPEEHELLAIAGKVDFSFIREKTRDLYTEEVGRPSYPPVVMFKILFLEFYYTLSDVEVIKQLRFNILFRYFVGLKAEDPVPDDSSLVVFRRRLAGERFEEIFNEFIRQCKEKGLLQEKLKLIDATHLIADVAIPATLTLLREGRTRIIHAVEEEKGSLSPSLRKYRPPEKVPQKPTKSDLAKEVALSQDLVREVKGKYSRNIQKLVETLEGVLGPGGKRKIVSFIDPDARFGTKNATTRFVGYKVHVAEDESQIVTSCEILPGDENEGQHDNLERLLHKEDEKGLTSEAIVCDTLYDSFANRRAIQKRGMEHYIPEKRKKKKLNEFLYEQAEDRFICAKGHASLGRCYHKDGHYYYFSARPCRGCEVKETCCPGREHPLIYVSDSHRLYMRTDQEKMKVALRKRRRIEAKFAEAKRHHGMARARYRGRGKVAIQVIMTFLVMNLKRMVKLLGAEPIPAKLPVAAG